MPICWLCVCVCNYVLFFRRQHFIHSLDRYEHLLYAKHCVGHWIYKDTVLAQGAHTLAERWLYERCVIIKLHKTVQKKIQNHGVEWGAEHAELHWQGEREAHVQNLHILVGSWWGNQHASTTEWEKHSNSSVIKWIILT